MSDTPKSKLIQFYFHHRGLCLAAITLLVVFFVFRAPHVAQAAEDPETTDLIKSINDIILLIMRLSSAWLWPVLLMIGSLLDNDLIFGGAMGERLLSIWVQIRNLVNVVFVLILLAIAIYNVMGLGEEGGTLPLAFKTVMPKFVLALIAVNFSFLGVKVVLDFTNVITGAVFALPANITDSTKMQTEFQDMICGTSSNEVPMKPLWCNEKKLNDRAVNFFSRLDRSNITLAYAVQFGRAPNLKFIKDGIKDLGQLGFNIIFNTVLYFVYALSFIALLLVLLFRTVALWIGVVLSPLLALSIVLPNLKELAGGAGEMKDQFVKNAIAPIKIGLVLSIGYIMLEGFSADKSIHGEILSSSVLNAVDPNAIPTDITDLQQLMVAVGVIVIVWMGVFSAADETAAKGITGFIRDKAQTFGKFAATLPTFAQVIPTKSQGKVTLAQLGATLEDIPGRVQRERGSSLFGKEFGGLKNASNPTMLGKELGKAPHLAIKPEGWEALKNKLVELKIVTEEEFKALNLGAQYTPGDMQKIYNLPKFKDVARAIQDENSHITDAESFNKAASTTEQKKPITDSASAVTALKGSQTPAQLKADYPKAFENTDETAIGELQTAIKEIPEKLAEIFVSVDRDGKISVIGDARKYATPAKQLYETMHAQGATEATIQPVLTASQLPVDIKKAIAQTISDNTLRDSLMKQFNATTTTP
ncbi:hypothetical protein HYW83_03610 [Candidatus Peregrinibacteria bacterium]|nr:hypothetical protein [Candidatus Peregrinibacteria bacterium]